MYVHKDCPAVGSRRSDGEPDGIYLSGSVAASFNGDGRRFFADFAEGNGEITSIECLDCEATLTSYIQSVPVATLERWLEEDKFSKIEWK